MTLDDLRAAIAAGALDILNIKLSRVGGVSRALDYIRLCQEAGIGVSVGCSEDLGPGMAAIYTCPLSLRRSIRPKAWATAAGHEHHHRSSRCLPKMARARVPNGPGLGVTLHPTFLPVLPSHIVRTDLNSDSTALVRHVVYLCAAANESPMCSSRPPAFS